MIFALRGLIVKVRKPEIGDIERIAKWLSSDLYLENFGRIRKLESLEYIKQAEKILQDNANDFCPNKYYVVEDRFKKRPVGLAMLCKIDWQNRHAEYAYIIGERECRGKMFAGDLNITLFNYFFHGLNLNKVYGFVLSGNKASQRMNNFGGSHDGLLRMHQFQNSGVAADVHVFSTTKREFEIFVSEQADTLLRRHISRGLIVKACI